ncbi:uncharacterized protein LOC18995828 isoform X1 [Amborella trichopoda]|uniref:PHD-type domain-containing protein n=1 Tax=Amborella trichopoda TaxID=13333 RepID=W1PK58_AMBTC|nr:uncharacterized protein LOC18995828 isoform X1 [Amborella trichopoda]XP_020524349.1 uncharacterized protein LOC18995828 isoform X1 [Amborella trichopoda]XP_020524350.1 uncharacterized protein LOC18995828 isoform X1 [Amborella trichopoda]XP_020524351.1 uncharacterized protein LOC18995828 isoform X1 [Amborella trichopoda]XP_020524352.1 uncharacterized protein LOC18995828 isoform X1 [Amborella trichopoda]XP_020524353.1 uncharacterized protein LOC18995828 isoform X1 [Amborella trichopoda]XP_02|eukprot:XP_020524348.1 uncharacterized protein LOC18995828 isoform X1 [Amborella trichopoda]
MSKVNRSARKLRDEDLTSSSGSFSRKRMGLRPKGSDIRGSLTNSSGLRRSAREVLSKKRKSLSSSSQKKLDKADKSGSPSHLSPKTSKKKTKKIGVLSLLKGKKVDKSGKKVSLSPSSKKVKKTDKHVASKSGKGEKKRASTSASSKKSEKNEKKVGSSSSNKSGNGGTQETTSSKESGHKENGADKNALKPRRKFLHRHVYREYFITRPPKVEDANASGTDAGKSAHSEGKDDNQVSLGGTKLHSKFERVVAGSGSNSKKDANGITNGKERDVIHPNKKQKFDTEEGHLMSNSQSTPASQSQSEDSRSKNQSTDSQTSLDSPTIKEVFNDVDFEKTQLQGSVTKGKAALVDSVSSDKGAEMVGSTNEDHGEKDNISLQENVESAFSEAKYEAVDTNKDADYLAQNACKDKVSQRKRKTADRDDDTKVTAHKDLCGLESSSGDAASSSPPKSKRNKVSGTSEVRDGSVSEDHCATNLELQRVNDDSRNLVFMANVKASFTAVSTSEEVSERVSRSSPEIGVVVSCPQEEKAVKIFKFDASGKPDECRKKNINGLIGSCTTPNGALSLEEDRVRLQVSASREIFEENADSSQHKDLNDHANRQINACIICNRGGKLLCCEGKGCSKSYHLQCLDPPLEHVPPGVWHCLSCVKKKIELGLHSVSEGIESIWDVRDAKISNDGSMVSKEQLQEFFVKYKGLAHVHNRWVPKSQLLSEAPAVLAKYNKNNQKGKFVKWNSEWTKPHRLLQKRFLMPPNIFFRCRSHLFGCNTEWLVKWRGLDYEHITWELESATFFSSPEAKCLFRDYESRLEKAKKVSDPSITEKIQKQRVSTFLRLQKMTGGALAGQEGLHLSSVNKLREMWHKGSNALVIDDQERIARVISFILSLQSDICCPVLIVTTSSEVSVWESEFMRLASSVNVVVYSGSKDVRESIRTLEFYSQNGCVLFEVLVSASDAIVEDLEALDCLRWEAIIVDECHRSRVSRNLQQLGKLVTDFRLLLFRDQVKDSLTDYRNLLSFLEAKVETVSGKSSPNDSNNNSAVELKERFSRYLAYENKSDSSKFIEYWVPVPLSDVQLEQYCTILVSNAISLRSNLRNDQVGALQGILISTRKCCDHPYLVNTSLQGLLTEGLPPVEFLDVGVNASGKLQLLDKVLTRMKSHGQRVLILFQLIGGSGPHSIGDILDDYLRQRFGAESYERIDSGLLSSKKQAVLQMFNNKEKGRFVFLLENRACLPSIKLSSVDNIIIFDSDMNPLNDLRALQKITIDSPHDKLKVFRFYSPYTMEERVLCFAKQDMVLESNVQNISRGMNHLLLMWGATYLFNKLEELRNMKSSSMGTMHSCDQKFLKDVASELLNKMLVGNETSDGNDSNVVLRVLRGGLGYNRLNSLLGESEMNSVGGELPQAFWSKLLQGKSPEWSHLTGTLQRTRKKVQHFDGSTKKLEPENVNLEAKKKRKKQLSTIDPATLTPWLQDKKKAVAEGKKESIGLHGSAPPSATKNTAYCSNIAEETGGMSGVPEATTASNHGVPGLSTSRTKPNPEIPGIHRTESEDGRSIRVAQRSLHLLMKPELSKLSETLHLPENVKSIAAEFLDYVMNNHNVPREPETILQAFQISLCWIAASVLKYKMDRDASLALARCELKFECKKEEAESVYLKLKQLRPFLKDITRGQVFSGEADSGSQDDRSRSSRGTDAHELEEAEICEDGEIREESRERDMRVPTEKVNPHPNTNESVKDNGPHTNASLIAKLNAVKHSRMQYVLQKQKDEVAEIISFWKREKQKLERAKEIEGTRIFDKYKNSSSLLKEKSKSLKDIYAEKMDALDKRVEKYQQNLFERQHGIRNEENHLYSVWTEVVKSGKLKKPCFDHPLPKFGLRLEDLGSFSNSHSGENDSRNGRPVLGSPIESKIDMQALGGLAKSRSLNLMAEAEESNLVIEQRVSAGNIAMETVTVAADTGANCLDGRDVEVVTVGEISQDSARNQFQPGPGLGDLQPSHEITVDHNRHAVNAVRESVYGTAPEPLSIPMVQRDDATLLQPESSDHIASPSRPIIETHNESAVCDVAKRQNGPAISDRENGPAACSTVDGQNGPAVGAIEERENGVAACSNVEGENGPAVGVITEGGLGPAVGAITGRENGLAIGAITDRENGLAVRTIAEREHGPSIAERESCQAVVAPVEKETGPVGAIVDGENLPAVGAIVDRENGPTVVTIAERAVCVTSERENGLGVGLAENQNGPELGPTLERENGPAVCTIIERENNHAACAITGRESGLTPEPRAPSTQPQLEDLNLIASPSRPVMELQQESLGITLHTEVPSTSGSGSGSALLASIMQPVQTAPSASRSLQPGQSDPLFNEIIRISKEQEMATKKYEDDKLRLKLECEREIEEVKRKYGALLQDTETAFSRKKTVFEANLSKVNMNRWLAEAFKLRLHDLKMSPLLVQAPLPGNPSSLLHSHQPVPRPMHPLATPSVPHPSNPNPSGPYHSSPQPSVDPTNQLFPQHQWPHQALDQRATRPQSPSLLRPPSPNPNILSSSGTGQLPPFNPVPFPSQLDSTHLGAQIPVMMGMPHLVSPQFRVLSTVGSTQAMDPSSLANVDLPGTNSQDLSSFLDTNLAFDMGVSSQPQVVYLSDDD